ncbi:hypothetical protein [Microcoleus sp. B4-C1]|uniref:hypothetical protein n=1 Tax=Microcoleus sp. B4-C1 TaxID=2818660 RepID=UPI002FD747EE
MNYLQGETTKGVWVTNEGKRIPYTKETYQVTNDECSSYSVEITKWLKTTTISVSVVTGDKGIDDEWERRSLTQEIHRLAKLPHSEFDSCKLQLIVQAIEFAKSLAQS